MEDIYKAERILLYNGMEIKQGSLAKLSGVSVRTFKRKLGKESHALDNTFSLVEVENIPLYMMNKASPINYRYKIQDVERQHPVSTSPRDVPLVSDTYTYYHMYQKGVASTNELVIGRLLLPVINVPRIDLNLIHIDDVISTLLVGVLYKEGYFPYNLGYHKRRTICNHLLYCFQSICRGDSINSQSSAYKYLQEHDKRYSFVKLFERYSSYQVGIKGYRQRLLSYTTDVIFPELLNVFEELEIEEPKSIEPSDLVVPLGTLEQLKPKDMFYLISLCKGKTSQGYIIKNEIQDIQYSRVYSVMTSIASDTRNKLGYIGYDISACLQSISLQILGSKQYPTHSMLMRNKHRMRALLMRRLDKPLKQVKEILSAADNGKQYKKLQEKSRLLSQYIDESSTLADNFNKWMKKHHLKRYNLAHSMAKDEWVYTGKKIFKKSGKKNKYSLFFFCWTQIERDIREVMMRCVNEGIFVHQVHDAIYIHKSEVQSSIQVMEQSIKEQLGLDIKIEIS